MRSHLFFVLSILVFVVVPFLFWRGTWFGTSLTDAQLQEYFSDQEKPRRIQHALVQVERAMTSGSGSVKRWYPNVLQAANHPIKEVRLTAAWVMGQDTGYAAFHDELRALLRDDQPMVRRNAALSLVRFQDNAGKAEVLSMLEPVAVKADVAGKLAFQTAPGDELKTGQLLARIYSNGRTSEVFSPVPGTAGEQLANTGDLISPGHPLLRVLPDDPQLWEALRALFLIGTREDLPRIEKFTTAAYSDQVRAQARETKRNIEKKIRKLENSKIENSKIKKLEN